jgi:hypothetical protein
MKPPGQLGGFLRAMEPAGPYLRSFSREVGSHGLHGDFAAN